MQYNQQFIAKYYNTKPGNTARLYGQANVAGYFILRLLF